MTYYLKYRPSTIEDLDITSVRETLKSIIKSGEIPHSLLFNGPKGTGKTSAARIIAKVLNCEKLDGDEPCDNCETCQSITNGSNLDVIELDAASNRGIDDVRNLKESLITAPISSKVKVYIIDEAHMLTNDASNALLKTLEEPPKHVYFILATTNPEKLIETIKSRTVIVNFTKATLEESKRSLKKIITAEKLKVSDDELNTIIKLSNGSFRDATKLLEQFSVDNKLFKNINAFNPDGFVNFLIDKDEKKCMEIIKKYIELGLDINFLLEEVITNLQTKMLEKGNKKILDLVEIILHYQEYKKVSPIEELPLQLAVVKWCNS